MKSEKKTFIQYTKKLTVAYLQTYFLFVANLSTRSSKMSIMFVCGVGNTKAEHLTTTTTKTTTNYTRKQLVFNRLLLLFYI